MNINRYNYEEFFLLYVDDELTKAEREEVEAFVHDNPDLEEELVMLRQSKLRPDAAITFQGKESLLKPESGGFIGETNYEEFFLLYVDGELNAAERREVEAFAATQPHLRQELDLLLQTKLEPEPEIVFPDKSLLYKDPKKERPVIIITWQRIVAVAAMLLLALGVFWVMNSGKVGKPDSVATTQQDQQQQPAPEKDVAENNTETTVPEIKEPANEPQLAVQDKNDKPDPIIRRNTEPVSNDKQLAYEPQKIDLPNNPVNEPETSLETADVARVEKNASVNRTTGLNANAVQTTQPLVQTIAYTPSLEEEDDDVYIANTTVNRKNKLRGLFRKVSRVFEKTTNLPAVEERGILIGNIEIALK